MAAIQLLSISFNLKARSMTKQLKGIVILSIAGILCACNKVDAEHGQDHIVSQTVTTALQHPGRLKADLPRDKRRKPAEVLEFFDVQPGMDVMEIMAGGGYYSEILARVVGPTGSVMMQNNQKYYDFQSDRSVKQRLENHRLPNVQRWDKELDNLDLQDSSLDAVFFMLVFHDLYWMTGDVSNVIERIHKSLKPNGIVAIVDHAAQPDSGATHAMDLNGLHRIDEQFVIDQFLSAGFVLEGNSDLLRNPKDDRTQAFFSESLKNKPTDRFILKFKKPES